MWPRGFASLLVVGLSTFAGEFHGSIVNVDVANSKLHVVQPDGKLLIFLTISTTVISLDGTPVTLIALQPGFRVRAKTNGNTMVAARIDAFKL